MAPFDTRGLNLELMSDEERDWLNTYHARVLETLAPLLETPVSRWLTRMCAPV